VTSGEGGEGGKQVVECVYIRDVTPPRPTIANDQACDCVHVVFETTNQVMGMPALSKQSVPGGGWTGMGTATEEQTGIPGTRRWWWAWPTWPEKNADVNFKVVYTKPMPPTQITVGPVTFTVDNTVVSGTDALLLWDGTNAVTIPWTITHSPYGSPVFDVTVAIYPVGSTSPVKTFLLEDQPLSEDPSSLEWEGETDAQPPGQIAPPGVYRYKVTALHVGEGPGCTDSDKAAALAPQVTGLHFTGAASDSLSGHVEYTMNRDAASCFARIYGQAPGGVPQQLGGDVTCADATQGTHTSNTFTVTALRDPNGHLAGTYWAVVFATETQADGQTYNRDQAQKPAMQHGVDRDSPIRIKSISFLDAGEGYGGDNEHDLWESWDYLGWNDGPAIVDPAWVADGPDEGAALDKNEPACYTRSIDEAGEENDVPSRMRVSVTVHVEPAGATFNLVAAEGGTEWFRQSGLTATGADQTVTMLAADGRNLPIALAKLTETFTWQVELQGTTPAGTLGLGSSTHTIYVVYSAPVHGVEGQRNYPTDVRLDFCMDAVSGDSDKVYIANHLAALVDGWVNQVGPMEENPRWVFWARDPVDYAAGCNDQAALVCSALGVVGVEGVVHQVYATCHPVPAPYDEQEGEPDMPLFTVNDYVSYYHYHRMKTRGAWPAPLQQLEFRGNHFEGCFRVEDGVEDGGEDDGNMWWVVSPYARPFSTARDLLRWYADENPQLWRYEEGDYVDGEPVPVPSNAFLFPRPKILGGPD